MNVGQIFLLICLVMLAWTVYMATFHTDKLIAIWKADVERKKGEQDVADRKAARRGRAVRKAASIVGWFFKKR